MKAISYSQNYSALNATNFSSGNALENIVMDTFRQYSSESVENYSKHITLIPLDQLPDQQEVKKNQNPSKCKSICKYIDDMCHSLFTNTTWRFSSPQHLMDLVSNKIIFKYQSRQFSMVHLA